MMAAKNMMAMTFDDDDGDKSSKLEMPKEKDHKYFKSPLFVKNNQEKVDKIKSAANAQ